MANKYQAHKTELARLLGAEHTVFGVKEAREIAAALELGDIEDIIAEFKISEGYTYNNDPYVTAFKGVKNEALQSRLAKSLGVKLTFPFHGHGRNYRGNSKAIFEAIEEAQGEFTFTPEEEKKIAAAPERSLF